MNFQKIKRKKKNIYIYIYLFQFHFIILSSINSILLFYNNKSRIQYIYILINDMIYCDCRMIKKILL